MGYCLESDADFDPSESRCSGCGAELTALDPGAPADAGEVYLFSSFRDEEEGLVLAYSPDLVEWHEIPGPHLGPSVGDGIMRDPFVARGPDGTFHMVWTSGWDRRDIGYARSEDLVEWSEPRLLPVMEDEPETVNCWAPKIFHDERREQWQIIWSSWVQDEERFGTPDLPETNKNHRIWNVTTDDFETLGDSEVLFDPGYSCIDAYLQAGEEDEWLLFFKDERYNKAEERATEHQNVRMARAADRYGPFGDVSEPITGHGPLDWHNEGPCSIRVDGQYYVFYDLQYIADLVGVVTSSDLVHWEDVSTRMNTPDGFKHGHVLRVPAGRLEESFGLDIDA